MITLPISGLEVKPLNLKQKELPPTPKTTRISILEDQVEMLRRENQSLQDQIDIWGHQINRDRQVAEASKNLANGMTSRNLLASLQEEKEKCCLVP